MTAPQTPSPSPSSTHEHEQAMPWELQGLFKVSNSGKNPPHSTSHTEACPHFSFHYLPISHWCFPCCPGGRESFRVAPAYSNWALRRMGLAKIATAAAAAMISGGGFPHPVQFPGSRHMEGPPHHHPLLLPLLLPLPVSSDKLSSLTTQLEQVGVFV